MFEGIKENDNWAKWYNKELMQLFGHLDILSLFKDGWIELVMLIEWIVKEKQAKKLTIILSEVN